jgi:phage/plasmid-associated DNA primase
MSDDHVKRGEDIVTRLQRLLGQDIVLVWTKPGEKSPSFKGWPQTTLETMRDPRYLKQLRSGCNLAVLLGKASGGICSIDIDDDRDVAPFLEANPALAGSLRSKARRGCNIWVKMQAGYPGPAALKTRGGKAWGEWRSTGNITIIHGLHPEGLQYHFEHEAAAVEIDFTEIEWPRDLRLPWMPEDADESAEDPGDQALRAKFGEPVFFGKGRGDDLYVKGVNEGYWAGVYSSENIALYEPDEQAFYRYDPQTGLYGVESADVIKQAVSARLLQTAREVEDLGLLETFRTNATLNAITAQLRGIIEHRGAFARKQRIVHLANGVIRFGGPSPEFVPFSPDFRSRNRSPIPFIADARCPRFLGELVGPAVHPEDVLLLQKMAGQFLLGENLCQRLVILDGLAERGKSTYAIVTQGLVGIANVTQLRTQHLHERFELFKYLRRTLLIGVDVDAGFLSCKGAPVIKGLVGADWFDAEQKGGTGSFQFQGKFNILMTSNARLRVRLQGDVGAWRRRLLIVRYEGPPPSKKIPNFADQLLQDEGSGILNWALEGLELLLQDLEETGSIRLTDRQRGIVDSLLAESDSVREFLKARVRSEQGSVLTSDELSRAYAQYCRGREWEVLPQTMVTRELSVLMPELFGTTNSHSIVRDNGTKRGYHDVAFIEEED